MNAVARGSISTERYESLLERQTPAARASIERQMARLQPLGRVGSADEVSDVVDFLLSERASFVIGVVLPVNSDGAPPVAIPRRRDPAPGSRINHGDVAGGDLDNQASGRASTKPAALKSPSNARASRRRSRRMTAKLVASTNE